jgi:Sulfotransferase domain/N-terminal domain of galactosyltransferase
MIALCTTCKGRAPHIKQTLPRNLADNPSAKFILLNYNSPDSLVSYVQANHAQDIESGRLVMYSHLATGPFRMAHAKNMAHRLAIREGAEVLVNLDGDNFTGPGFADYVRGMFEQAKYDRRMFGCPNVFMWARMIQGKMKRGVSGRIAMTSRAFLLSGGYDERYADWGPDDKDMSVRLERLGLLAVEIPGQFLDAIHHKDHLRFKEYPHARPVNGGASCDQFYLTNERTIANFGNFGCGTVYRNFDFSCPIELRPLPTRIFGIGMQKTATTSLGSALEHLGFDSAHWLHGKWAVAILKEMRAKGRSETLERHYALCDLPIAILFRELDCAYAGSKFILTVRDDVDWLVSARDHWSYKHNKFRPDWDKWPAADFIHRATYGQKWFDAEVMLKRYKRHNDEVREYFRKRPSDLLVMDMSRGAGWAELCPFVERPIPSLPYPRAYAAY